MLRWQEMICHRNPVRQSADLYCLPATDVVARRFLKQALQQTFDESLK